MRRLHLRGALALLLFVIIFSGNSPSAQARSPYTAKVVSLDGYVGVTYAGTDKFVSLPPWGTLSVGDVIETGNKARIVLKLPDGSKLVMGENSRIVIKELGEVEVTKVTKSVFELARGKIRAIVKPFVSKDSVFNIETNNATTGVRGTDFGVTYDPHVDTTHVLGMTGTVSLSLTYFPELPPIIIEEGHEISVSGSNKPGPPSEVDKETTDEFLEGVEVTGAGGNGEINHGHERDHRDGGESEHSVTAG